MKTHCSKGHDKQTVGVTKDGHCHTCYLENKHKKYHALPEVAARDKIRDMYAHAYIWQPEK